MEPRQTWRRIYDLCREGLFVRKIVVDGAAYRRYKGVLYPEYLFNKKASTFIVPIAQSYCAGRGLDIGAGAWPLPGSHPVENAPDENAYRLDRFEDNSLDYIFSSHCIEHLERWEDALRLWVRKLKPGGTLFIYVPHPDMVMWRPSEVYGRQHVWSPSFARLSRFLEENGNIIVAGGPERDNYFSFHCVARKKLRS